MWQRLGLATIVMWSIYFIFGSGMLLGTAHREEDEDKNFLVGLGLGLVVSGFLGLAIIAGLVVY